MKIGKTWMMVDERGLVNVYSNFRKYAAPPDEKRCIITEKPFSCSLGIFLVLVLPKYFKFGSLLMSQKKCMSDWQKNNLHLPVLLREFFRCCVFTVK